VLLWSESENQVLVAVDEDGPDGTRDGKVDHVFAFQTTQPLGDSFRFRDPSAIVREQGPQLTVVLPSQGQVFRFLLSGTRNVVSSLDADKLMVRTFRSGVGIQRYSDSALHQIDLEVIADRGASALSEGAEKVLTDFTPPPSTEGGGSCQSSCSISANSCPGGSCSASCSTGYCAKCECIVQAFHDCRCGLK
jgi:hypothetical protein